MIVTMLNSGNWNDCDRGGCQNNAFYVDSNMFCPEDRYQDHRDTYIGLVTPPGPLEVPFHSLEHFATISLNTKHL